MHSPTWEWRCICITQGKNSERLVFVYKQTKSIMFFIFAQTRHFFQDLLIMTFLQTGHLYKQRTSPYYMALQKVGREQKVHPLHYAQQFSRCWQNGPESSSSLAWTAQPENEDAATFPSHDRVLTFQSPTVTNQLSESMWSVVLASWRQKATSRNSPICLPPLSGTQFVPELTEDCVYGGKVKSWLTKRWHLEVLFDSPSNGGWIPLGDSWIITAAYWHFLF